MLHVKRERLTKRADIILAAAAIGSLASYWPIRQMILKQSEDFTICHSTHTVMFLLAILCFAQAAEIITKRIWRARCGEQGLREIPPPKRLILAVYSFVAILMFTIFIQAGYTPVFGG